MRRRHLLAGCLLVAIPVGSWQLWSSWTAGPSAPIPSVPGARVEARSAELARVRAACDLEALDAFVEEQRTLARAGQPQAWRVLAEALLERIATRVMRKGMKVGSAVFDAVPPAIAADIDEGLRCLDAARRGGDDSSETWRIEAGLLCYRITGWAAALQLDGRIAAAIDRAVELDPMNPRMHVALGCRKLFAPPLLGQDLDKASEHLLWAANALPDDERPLVFAAMAAWLAGRITECRELLSRAADRNPRNVYAIEVARRLAAGEDDPFGRDVR
jgi:hypothetical protein